MTTFLWLSLALIIAMINMMVRNNKVCIFRMALVDQISDCAKHDLKNGLDWQWRYETLDSVTYDQMLFSFKRLTPENYYRDTTFLEMTDVSGNEPQQ